MHLFSDINSISLIANCHPKELYDPLHCTLHGLECDLEVVGRLRQLRVSPYGIPHPLELSTGQLCSSEVILDKNVHGLETVVFLI